MNAAEERVALWRAHPAQMVRDLFKVEPDAWQAEALEAFPHSPRLAMKACKGPGKTCVLAWIGWNFALTRPDAMIGCTSINGDNLKSGLWTELARWHAKAPLLQSMFEVTKSEIFHKDYPKTWKIEARRWARDADAGQIGTALAGLHAPYVMWLLDESGSYPPAILPTCEAIFSGEPIEAHIVQAGNPLLLSGPLYRACVLARDLWKVIEITGDPDDPKRSPRIPVEHAREQIKQYGRDNPWVLVNIFGKFPPSSPNTLIGPDEVSASMKRWWREMDIGNAPKVIGVDVARFGDDASVLAARQGIQMLPFKKWRNLDSTQGAGQVTRYWNDWEADACFIDATGGFGAGWLDQIRGFGKSPIGVEFAGQAHDIQRYYNKRTEMAFDFVAWIKRGGALPEDGNLLAALTETTYAFKGDRMLLEPKEMVKERIGFSPDEMDACFTAGTLISTPHGDFPIEELKVGDPVLTPYGVSRILINHERSSDKLTRCEFSNGASFVSTPNHELFVFGCGAVRVDELSMTMALSSLQEREEWLKESALFIGARRIGFKILVDILARGIPFSVRGCCIVGFGLNIMARFQKIMRSTTRTMIGATRTSKTLSFSLAPSIGRSIPSSGATLLGSEKLRTDTCALLKMRPENGTAQRLGWHGTANTRSIAGRTVSPKALFAKDAEAHFGLICRILPGFVRLAARTQRLIERITRTCARAIGAERPSSPTATGKQRVVPVSVQTASVPPTRVYNLTLDRDNAYYANGMLAFNCMCTFAEPVQPAARISRGRQSAIARDYDEFAEMNRGHEVGHPYGRG